jgi:lipid-binding SYLF domain-containing protein
MRLIVLAAVALTPLLAMDNQPGRRLNKAAAVFSEVMATPAKRNPQDLLEGAHCIVVVPGVKTAAFIFGGKFMLVTNERGADKLLSSKFTLGAEGSVAAGPVGRTATAQTDAQMHAEILSWSRSQGLFAGIALEGATLRQDLDDNATLYGKRLENRDIVTSGVAAPSAVAKLLDLLNQHSAHERVAKPTNK